MELTTRWSKQPKRYCHTRRRVGHDWRKKCAVYSFQLFFSISTLWIILSLSLSVSVCLSVCLLLVPSKYRTTIQTAMQLPNFKGLWGQLKTTKMQLEATELKQHHFGCWFLVTWLLYHCYRRECWPFVIQCLDLWSPCSGLCCEHCRTILPDVRID